jgi:hypothetical protein
MRTVILVVLSVTALAAYPSIANADPVIAAAGDIACDPTNPHFKGGLGDSTDCRMLATSNVLLQLQPTAVLPLGDVQYECGGLAAFQQSYGPTWGRLFAQTFPAIGNHEYGTSGGTNCDATGQAAGYFTYFGQKAGPQTGYYSYDLGGWHLISLNTNCAKAGGCYVGSAEEKWLKADLATHPTQCTLAYWHHPRWSSVTSSSASKNFWTDIYQAGGDVVLSGHVHNYERIAPTDPAGSADGMFGIRQFVVGTGGESLQGYGTPLSTSEMRAKSYGVLELTLHPSSYDWRFLTATGGVLDAGNAPCHGAPPEPSAAFDDDFESGDFSGADWTVSGMTVQPEIVDTGTYAARASISGNPGYAWASLSRALTNVYAKARINLVSQASTSSVNIIKLQRGTGAAIAGLSISPTGKLTLRNDVSGITTTSSTLVSKGAWHTVELHVVTDAGISIQVWFDGNAVAELSQSTDGVSAGTARLQIGEPSSGRTSDTAYDNVAVDTSFLP